MGKRLKEFTKDNTKCMVRVNGEMLIDRVVAQLLRLGVSRLVVVTGYKGESLRRHLGTERGGMRIEYVDNPDYWRTNNIYSLWLAKDKLQQEDTLLLESDLIFDYGLLEGIAQDKEPNLALVAKYEPWMDGTMVQIDKDRNIVNFVPKKAFDYKYSATYYKTVNIYKFSKEFSANKYVPFLEAYIKAVGNNEYYENVLSIITFLNSSSLKALPVNGGKWYEIDDKLDLDTAELIFAGDGDILGKLSARHGGLWRIPRLLDFSFPTNVFFAASGMTDELEANFRTLLSSSPSAIGVSSLCASKCWNVREKYVVPGNGVCELVEKLRRELGGTVCTVRRLPAVFGRTNSSDTLVYVPQSADLSYSAEDIMEFLRPRNAGILMLSNPDLVTGSVTPRKDILRLAEWCGQRNMHMVVDESAADFCTAPPECSVLDDSVLEQHPHVAVVKSMAAYGIAGIRLAILCSGDSGLVGRIKASSGLWNVNSVAEFFMQILGKYESGYARSCEALGKEREHLREGLGKSGVLKAMPSQANFLLCEVMKPATVSALLLWMLRKHNILLHDSTAQVNAGGREFVRIAVRSHADNAHLLAALCEAGAFPPLRK